MNNQEFNIPVRFAITAHTILSEEVYVCGSCPELGCWDYQKSIKLYTDPKNYPQWTSNFIMIKLAHSYNITYKYIKKLGANIIWEKGSNRALNINPADFIENLTLKDREFCHNVYESLGSYGTKNICEEGKYTEYIFSYKEFRNLAKLCPYEHNKNPNDIQVFISNHQIQFINPQTHKVLNLYSKMQPFIFLDSYRHFFVCSKEGFMECKYNMQKGLYSKYYPRKRKEFPNHGCYSKSANSLYFVHNNCIEKICLFNLSKTYLIGNPSIFENSENSAYIAPYYVLGCKVINERYIYYITKNFISRFDVLDENEGWILICDLTKLFKNYYPIFIGFSSDFTVNFYCSGTKIHYILDIQNSNNSTGLPLIKHMEKINLLNESQYYESLKCAEHKVNLFLKPGPARCIQSQTYDFNTKKSCNIDYLISSEKEYCLVDYQGYYREFNGFN